jgi:hypothetical protein
MEQVELRRQADACVVQVVKTVWRVKEALRQAQAPEGPPWAHVADIPRDLAGAERTFTGDVTYACCVDRPLPCLVQTSLSITYTPALCRSARRASPRCTNT